MKKSSCVYEPFKNHYLFWLYWKEIWKNPLMCVLLSYYKSMQNSVWLDCPKCPWIVMSLQYLWKQYSYWKKRQSPSLTRQFMGGTSSALLNMCVKSYYLQPFFLLFSTFTEVFSINFCNFRTVSTADCTKLHISSVH